MGTVGHQKAICRKLPRLIALGWRLLHVNAPSYTSLIVQQFLAKHNIKVLPHPQYSPALAPFDFYLFPELKSPLRGRHFGSQEELELASSSVLRTVEQNGFLHVFHKWCDRLGKCITIGSGYVEE